MAAALQINNATQPLPILLVLTSDHITGATGKTVTVTIQKNDGAGFVAPNGAVTEAGNGWYEIAPNAADANVLGPLLVHATAPGCDPADKEFVVVPNLAALAAALSPSSTSPLALTARTLIEGALQEINVIADGETATGPMMTLGLATLNRMVDGWNTERLLLPVQMRSTFTFIPNQAALTIGPSGNLTAIRPMSVDRAGVVPIGSTTELPIVPMTREAYDRIPIKTLSMVWPVNYIYEPTMPDGTLTFYGVPSTAATLVLYVLTALAQFADLDTAYAFQPGYYNALYYNLARKLARPFGAMVDQDLVTQAEAGKGHVKRQNEVAINLPVDATWLGRGSGGIYNIWSDSNY